MRKIILLLSLLSAAVLSINAQQFIAKEVTGRVEYQVPGGNWLTADKGIEIPVSATISTGFQSRAILESPRSTIIVQPLTRLTIDELQNRGASNQTSISLRTGRISASVKKNEDEPTRFQVKSPIATAAVRGTEFTFNGFQLTVESGLVAFSSEGGRIITVPLGGSSEMLEDGIPVEVVDALLEQISVNPSAVSDLAIPLLDSLDSLDVLGLIDFSIDDLIVTVQ
ncbi:MAG: FecR family protein [Spirochaetaceae bacterium]|jgi:hypothetical protein|nr:FecR family protein [Spirochaetaceae bacterium]